MSGKLLKNGQGLLGAVAELFGRAPSAAPPDRSATSSASLAEVEQAFNVALQQLNHKIEQLRQEQQDEPKNGQLSAVDLALERERRMQHMHTLIGLDILAMHRRLATGIDREKLDDLVAFIQECREMVTHGRTAAEVMSCCLSSVLRRLHREAGVAAWTELETRLQSAGETWPEVVWRDPIESEANFLQHKQLKYAESRAAFIAYEPGRSAELIYGIESAWQSDYPEPGSPLWRAVVLEGVATALRVQWLKAYYDQLVQRQDAIQAKVATLVGAELAALKTALAEKQLTTLEEAHRVAASSSRVVDEVIPEVAWQEISAALSTAGVDRP